MEFGQETKPLVYIGADHAGYEMKGKLKDYLDGEGFDVVDLGCFNEGACDYPDQAREVGEKVIEHPGSLGVLLCGSGIGISVAANKLKGIRASVATSVSMAESGKRHNNLNVISIGARDTDFELAKQIAKTFLTTPFEAGEERHVRRVEKINKIENGV